MDQASTWVSMAYFDLLTAQDYIVSNGLDFPMWERVKSIEFLSLGTLHVEWSEVKEEIVKD